MMCPYSRSPAVYHRVTLLPYGIVSSTVVQEVGTAQAKLLRSINPNAALSKADQSSEDAQRRLRSAKELSARYDLAIVEVRGYSTCNRIRLVIEGCTNHTVITSTNCVGCRAILCPALAAGGAPVRIAQRAYLIT